jgi:hypothetical protein
MKGTWRMARCTFTGGYSWVYIRTERNSNKKEVDFDGGKVMVARLGDQVISTSAYCTHYGASLAKGVLTADGRVVCPWYVSSNSVLARLRTMTNMDLQARCMFQCLHRRYRGCPGPVCYPLIQSSRRGWQDTRYGRPEVH